MMSDKKWKLTALAVAAVMIGWLGFANGGGSGVAKAETAPAAGVTAQNTITVNASGTVEVDPDIAYVNAAIQTKGGTAAEAQQANADKFAAAEKALYGKFGLDKKDVQTTGFYVQPEYNYTEKDGRKLTGYSAVHSLKISYRDLAGLGKLLDALSAAGVNQMNGVQFGTEKTDQYELDALKKAMANAKAKADVLASAAQRQVKGVVNIAQGTSAAPPVLFSSGVAAQVMDAASASSASTSVQPGQIEISASVTVQYQM